MEEKWWLFDTGDHLRYVGAERRCLPVGGGPELFLTAGMIGTVMPSTGTRPGHACSAATPQPWRCRVQFPNGHEVEITRLNVADFEKIRK
jgi:hypothetical protein